MCVWQGHTDSPQGCKQANALLLKCRLVCLVLEKVRGWLHCGKLLSCFSEELGGAGDRVT